MQDEPAKILANVPVTDAYNDQYTKRNPSVADVDTTPHMYVNLRRWRGGRGCLMSKEATQRRVLMFTHEQEARVLSILMSRAWSAFGFPPV